MARSRQFVRSLPVRARLVACVGVPLVVCAGLLCCFLRTSVRFFRRAAFFVGVAGFAFLGRRRRVVLARDVGIFDSSIGWIVRACIAEPPGDAEAGASGAWVC